MMIQMKLINPSNGFLSLTTVVLNKSSNKALNQRDERSAYGTTNGSDGEFVIICRSFICIENVTPKKKPQMMLPIV